MSSLSNTGRGSSSVTTGTDIAFSKHGTFAGGSSELPLVDPGVILGVLGPFVDPEDALGITLPFLEVEELTAVCLFL